MPIGNGRRLETVMAVGFKAMYQPQRLFSEIIGDIGAVMLCRRAAATEQGGLGKNACARYFLQAVGRRIGFGHTQVKPRIGTGGCGTHRG